MRVSAKNFAPVVCAMSFPPTVIPGVTYGKDGEYDQAIADYNQAIHLNSNYLFWAYNNLGVAYAQKGEVDEALENFDIAIKVNPHHPEFYSNRGTSYGTKGEHTKALADFNRSLSIDPECILRYRYRPFYARQ